jgi:hypothetical protein
MIARDSGLMRRAALGAVLAVAPVLATASSQTGPVIITTDTPEYCQKLFDRIREALRTATEPPPSTVGSLSTEGQHLCDEGLTRPGILRLRRALLLLREGSPAP